MLLPRLAPALAGMGLALLSSTLPGPVLAHGALDEQLAEISVEITHHPDDPGLYLRRAELRRIDRRWDDAAADLARAQALDPRHPGPTLGRAALLLDSGEPARAVGLLDSLLATGVDPAVARSLRARAHAALGDPAAAVADLDRVIASTAARPELYLERARLILSIAPPDRERALRGLDQGIERLGSITGLEEAALRLELELGRFDAALARLDRRIARHPRVPALQVRRGELLAGAGRALEAAAAYSQALEMIEELPATRRSTAAIAALESRARAGLQTHPSPIPGTDP